VFLWCEVNDGDRHKLTGGLAGMAQASLESSGWCGWQCAVPAALTLVGCGIADQVERRRSEIARKETSTSCSGTASCATPMMLLTTCGLSVPYMSLRTFPAAWKPLAMSIT